MPYVSSLGALALAACSLGCVEEEHVVLRPVPVMVPVRVGRAAPRPYVPPAPIAPPSAPGRYVGAGAVIGPLVVLPVIARDQPVLPPILTLDEAIRLGTAVVHDTGTTNSVEIESRADVEVYVLAGTVLTGGDQDREIGEDVVVGVRARVHVRVYCVERGRSSPRHVPRNGGDFGTLDVLVGSEVRAAGQYERSQDRVWALVADANEAHGKSRSGTLVESLSDPAVARRREELAGAVNRWLEAVAPGQELVGIAYGVGGRLRSVRWFATHDLFQAFRRQLVEQAAIDGVFGHGGGGGVPPGASLATSDVVSFVAEIEAAEKNDRRTEGDSTSRTWESPRGWGTAVLVPTASGGRLRYAADFTAK